MQVSRQQIVDFIRDRGDATRAEQAGSELPDFVEIPGDEEQVLRYGVDPLDLAGDTPDHG